LNWIKNGFGDSCNGVLLGSFSSFQFSKNGHIAFKYRDLTCKINWVRFANFNLSTETSKVGLDERENFSRFGGTDAADQTGGLNF